VFTGQGAQSAEMGRQLTDCSPLFRETLDRCDRVLHCLTDGPSWSIIEELSKSKEETRLSETQFSQPLSLYSVGNRR
jgi:acyl transferase domain-containing protein